jgi:hypothetical protein
LGHKGFQVFVLAVQAVLVVPIPFSELLGRFQTAVNPARVGVLDHHLMEVIALREAALTPLQ